MDFTNFTDEARLPVSNPFYQLQIGWVAYTGLDLLGSVAAMNGTEESTNMNRTKRNTCRNVIQATLRLMKILK